MAIISFSKDTLIDYVPAYGGNRESAEPCVVRLRFVPYSKVQDYSRQIAARLKGVTDPAKQTDISREIQKRQFMESVDSISGYTVDGQAITTADAFYDTADTDLIIEVIKAMESASKLSEGQKKN